MTQVCKERGGLDEDELYEAHWAGEGELWRKMCGGKKQACTRYPSPRSLIPEGEWKRGGSTLPQDELDDMAKGSRYVNPKTGKEETFKGSSPPGGLREDL